MAAEHQGSIRVLSLAGRVLAEVSPVPQDVAALKAEIEERTRCPIALQRLIDGAHICSDQDVLAERSPELTMIVDESPMFTWDVDGNPAKDMLEGDGGMLSSPNLRRDFCNVLTKEPVRSGKHYFKFIMHHIGDEQWCGLIQDTSQAGCDYSGRSMTAWTYYCGRVHSSSSSIIDGHGALHAEGRAVAKFTKLQAKGDVIGMLVDLDEGAVAFDLNGELQGACAVPKTPLWVVTHMDTPSDCVELQKPSLMDAPPSNLDALTSALLDVSQGQKLMMW